MWQENRDEFLFPLPFVLFGLSVDCECRYAATTGREIYGIYVCMCMLSHFSHVSVTLWTVACQAPLPTGFSREEYWNGLPCTSPADLPDTGVEPTSLESPALAEGFFTIRATWEDHGVYLRKY